MKKRWTLESYNSSVAQHLQEVLNINPIFCQILAQRGISTYDEAHHFFRPSLNHLHNPFLFFVSTYINNYKIISIPSWKKK